MSEVNPKGGKLLRSTNNTFPEERLNMEIDKVIKMFPSLTREQARIVVNDKIEDSEIYLNNIYQVRVYRGSAADELVHIENLNGRCTWLSMKRKDKRPMNNWQDMQTIKNRLVGTECDAFQIFPAESRMLNTANQYHLIVLPEGYLLPFGWHEGRSVVTENSENNAGSTQYFGGEQL